MPDVTHTKNGIPKLFHYIWIKNEKIALDLGNQMPEKFVNNMKGWKQKHQDYTIECWDNMRIRKEDELMDRLNSIKNVIPHDPYNPSIIHPDMICAGFSYAVISDYIRYYILSKYGGIYIDTDMFCVRSSEPNIETINSDELGVANEVGVSYCNRLKNKRINNNFMVCPPNSSIMKTILEESHQRLIEILTTKLPTENVMAYRDYTVPDLTYGEKLKAVAYWIGPRWIDYHILNREEIAPKIKTFAFWQYGMCQHMSIARYKDRSWDLTFAYHESNSIAEWNNGKYRKTKWEWPFI